MEALARSTDPETSHAAARSISARRISELQTSILGALVQAGSNGLTDEEITWEVNVGDTMSSLRTRRAELVALGFVIASPLTRLSYRGRKMTVWIATQAGRDYRVPQE